MFTIHVSQQGANVKEELRKVFGNSVSSTMLARYNRSYYERACAGELTRISAKTWDLRSNTTQVEQAVETQPTVDKYSEIFKRFGMLQTLGEAVVQGNMNSLMVAGAPGVGKTYELERRLEAAINKKDIESFVSIKGTISALILYKTLYENKEKGQVVLLDDVDRIFGDEEAMNILKAALDSSVVRKVCWGKNSRFLQDEGIPNEFSYSGQVIFITNTNPDKVIAKEGRMSPHMNALISRCVFLDLCIHEPSEILMRIEQVMKNSTILDDLNLDDTQADMILNWMRLHTNSLRSVSIRTVLQLAGFVKTSPTEWEDIATATLIKRF